MSSHDHHHFGSGDAGERHLQVLVITLCLTAAFVLVELAGGAVFHSLALLSDAAHVFSDTVALAIAVLAQRMAARPASSTHSFGWRRAEVLAAQANGLLLLLVSVAICVAAVDRLDHPKDVNAAGMMVIAALGLVVNLVGTSLLHRAPGENMNVRAAALHTASDAAGSAAAFLAGLVIALGGSDKADPVASIVIAALVVVAAVRLLRDTTYVLLEATPRGLDPAHVERVLREDPAVTAVHHLHIWALAPGALALSAHIEMEGPMSLHEAQAESERLKAKLAERLGVGHSTLELECHPCEDG